MKKVLYFVVCLPMLLVSACDVHELPETPESVKLLLRLNYETDMTEWQHLYDGESVIAEELGDSYDNRCGHGKIRYVVRVYNSSEKQRVAQEHAYEFIFTRDIADGYSHEVMLDLPPGNYSFMVWSDLKMNSGDDCFYNADNFAEITLQGKHKGNTDYRDAFRGTSSIELVSDIMKRLPYTLDIAMQRPLAKFEFVTCDVMEFINKEMNRIASKAGGDNSAVTDDASRAVNIEDYRVVFYYVGFMPHVYNLYADKRVDSSTGMMFETSLRRVTDSEASMGFDYVFVDNNESSVTVQVAMYDNDGTRLSLTAPIKLPLKRNFHTKLRGVFLMSEASGGVSISPSFDGDHNLIFP